MARPRQYLLHLLRPHWLFLGVVCLLALLCYREYERMVSNQQLHNFAIPGAVLGLLLLAVPQITWADFLFLPLLGLGLSLRTVSNQDDFKPPSPPPASSLWASCTSSAPGAPASPCTN